MSLLTAYPTLILLVLPPFIGALVWIASDWFEYYAQFKYDSWLDKLQGEFMQLRDWTRIAPVMIIAGIAYFVLLGDILNGWNVIFTPTNTPFLPLKTAFVIYTMAWMYAGWFAAWAFDQYFSNYYWRRHILRQWLKKIGKSMIDGWVALGKSFGPL